MHGCDHQGFHSGQGRYDAAAGTLRYIIVCDACDAELREVHAQPYAPAFDPHGNDAHLAA